MKRNRLAESGLLILCSVSVAVCLALSGCQTLSHPEVLEENSPKPLVALTFGGDSLGVVASGLSMGNHGVAIVKGSGKVPTSSGSFVGLGWIDLTAESPVSLDSFTIVARVRTGFNKHWQAIFNSDDYRKNDLHFQFAGQRLEFSIAGNSPGDAWSSYTFQPGSWYDLVVTYDAGAHVVDFYVNGKVAGEIKYTTAVPVSIRRHRIGAWSGEDRQFQGRMDYFYLFPSVLDPSLIQRYYGLEPKSH
jgi:hypothetical protein